jgi:hypothetical protein
MNLENMYLQEKNALTITFRQFLKERNLFSVNVVVTQISNKHIQAVHKEVTLSMGTLWIFFCYISSLILINTFNQSMKDKRHIKIFSWLCHNSWNKSQATHTDMNYIVFVLKIRTYWISILKQSTYNVGYNSAQEKIKFCCTK